MGPQSLKTCFEQAWSVQKSYMYNIKNSAITLFNPSQEALA